MSGAVSTLDLVARLLGPAGRREATMLSVDDAGALARAFAAREAVAVAAAEYLAALSRDRAACLFVAPEVCAAHDTLAEALAALGYVTLSNPLENQEERDGKGED